jgi:hypothetical protein
LQQRRRNGICGSLSGPLAGEHVAPPLQADFTGHRLAHAAGDAREFDIDSIERVQPTARFGWGKQAGEETVLVGLAHQRLTCREGIHLRPPR